MIADWTVEVGPDSPWIIVPWEGWIDPRAGAGPFDVAEASLSVLETLPEVQQYPELLRPMTLTNRLNCLTSKVDVFPVTREDADPEIAEAGERETAWGLGSYLDVLTVRLDVFPGFTQFERLASKVVSDLKKGAERPVSSVEIVVRPARMRFGDDDFVDTFGWTLYAMGFGETEEQARKRWAKMYGLLICYVNLQVCAMIVRYREDQMQAWDAKKATTGE